ncbi:hypothetical protein PSHT_04404 [Puccinia striiformis]|uniref:Uncharacterized protein n=2 Tax=Puccinia striiformis TaxID=27350 RepID=A0A2S4WD47_9BASI|nr:hypothetical protein PSTT_08958 [Puccinia striiformis]POW19673.1 hypothetical protein PSHT_04404 [Puccinia striiformis]
MLDIPFEEDFVARSIKDRVHLVHLECHSINATFPEFKPWEVSGSIESRILPLHSGANWPKLDAYGPVDIYLASR